MGEMGLDGQKCPGSEGKRGWVSVYLTLKGVFGWVAVWLICDQEGTADVT